MKKFFTILLLFCLFFTINKSAVSQETDENKKLLKIGVLLPLSGKYEILGNSFLKAIQLALYDISNDELVIYPKDFSSYLYLAKIFEKEENPGELEKNLNTTLLLDPKNEEALYMLIELHLSLSNFSKVKDLNEKFSLICSKLCNKKISIAEKINNLQTNSEKN